MALPTSWSAFRLFPAFRWNCALFRAFSKEFWEFNSCCLVDKDPCCSVEGLLLKVGKVKFHFAFRQWLHAFRVFLTFVTVTEPYCQVHTKADEEKAKEEATFICHLCIQGKQEDLMKQHSFPWNKFIVVYLSGYSSRKRRFVWLVCFACFFCFVCIVCSVCFVCLPGCLPTAGRGRCWEAIGLEPFSGAYAMGQVAKRWTGWLLKAVSARSKVSQIPNTQKLFTLS